MKNTLVILILIFELSNRTFAQKNTKTCIYPNNLLYSYMLMDNTATPRNEKPLLYHNGFVVTTNYDTLRGNIKFKEQNEIAVVYKKSGLNLYTSIKVSKVLFIRFYEADSLLNNQKYTDYIKMNKRKNSLWRQIYRGDFEIYDDLYSVNERPGEIGQSLLIKESPKSDGDIWTLAAKKKLIGQSLLIKESPKSDGDIWTLAAKKKLIGYINNKYSKELEKKDFRGKIDIINWLKLNV